MCIAQRVQWAMCTHQSAIYTHSGLNWQYHYKRTYKFMNGNLFMYHHNSTSVRHFVRWCSYRYICLMYTFCSKTVLSVSRIAWSFIYSFIYLENISNVLYRVYFWHENHGLQKNSLLLEWCCQKKWSRILMLQISAQTLDVPDQSLVWRHINAFKPITSSITTK